MKATSPPAAGEGGKAAGASPRRGLFHLPAAALGAGCLLFLLALIAQPPRALAAGAGSLVSSGPDCFAREVQEGEEVLHFRAGRQTCRAVLELPAGRLDFADLANAGGRLEFWLRFSGDPHVYQGNKFIFRTQPDPAVVTLEIYGSVPYLAFEMYNLKNVATPAGKRFLAYTAGWDRWLNWKAGEWHRITLSWRRNGGAGEAEMVLAIDGTSDGCPRCVSRHGFLPEPGSFKTLQLGNFGRSWGLDYYLRGIAGSGLDP